MNELELARECLLSMIADADRFDEDVDGDMDADGHRTCTIKYHLTVGHSQLAELCEVLGIKLKLEDTAKDAIDRALQETTNA